jgi:hypothetical protein
LQGFAEVFGFCSWGEQFSGYSINLLFRYLNALDQSLEIIAQPSSSENDRLNVTLALGFPRFGGRLRSLLGAEGALGARMSITPTSINDIKTAGVPWFFVPKGILGLL